MIQMLVGTTISGRIYGKYITQNCIFDRRHILGGLCSMALYKRSFDPSQGSLSLSRLYMSLCKSAKNIRHQKSKCCCCRFINCKACLQKGAPPMSYQTSDLTVLSETATVAMPNTEWNSMFSRDNELVSAIYYEAEGGFGDARGRTMRFSDFLSSRILALCSPFVNKSARILSAEVKKYARASIECRFELLNKISLLMGYKNINAMIAHERALRESTCGLQHLNEDRVGSSISLRDVFLDCDDHEGKIVSSVDAAAVYHEKFPCILVGSSPHVNLYSCTEEDSEKVDYQCIENDMRYYVEQMGYATSELDKENLHLSDEDKLGTAGKTGSKGHIIAATKVSLRNTTRNTEKRTTDSDWFLDAPIGAICDLTPTQRRRLDENGFHTVRKLLQHFPRAYVNFQGAHGELENGQLLTLTGRILSSSGKKLGNAMGMIEVIVECQIPGSDESCSGGNQYSAIEANNRNVYLHLKRFFRGVRYANPWLLKKVQSKYHYGDLVSVSGKVTALEEDNHFEMRDYNVDVLNEDTDFEKRELCQKEKLYPIYPSKGDLDRKYIGDCINRLLDSLPVDMDPLPDSVCSKLSLMKLREAYVGIHCPKNKKEAESARRRFIFDDFFYPQLELLFRRHEVVNMCIKNNELAKKSLGLEVGSVGVDKWSQLTLKVLRSLPFQLTKSQMKATSEIIWDLKRPLPMNRLLQGDVGCGKTVVALLAALEVIDTGFQAAFMVPTELLAVQHYETIVSILERINGDDRPSVALLTGSTPSKKACSIRNRLETGEIAVVVGTHSLISEGIKFAALHFAVVDEQHRFGVAQRGKFSSKICTTMDQTVVNDMDLEDGQFIANKAFISPHVLVMSATPIPRTLALALYGDMSFTKINESLPGRVPVKTFAFYGNNSGFEKAYKMVQEDLDNGGRVFLVYAAIDESKQLPQLRAATAELETVSNIFQGYKCGLLHGRMNISEKEAAIQQFKAGHIQILLSTQLIEVGIDIPEATMMVIINAERFGMAQLHQLRGRIGRGTKQATCILITPSSSGLERLKLLEKSSDGFHLAEADLNFRGPGNMLGLEQSGHLPEFSIARLETDGDVLELAHTAASDILQKHNLLEDLPKLKAELSMRHSFNKFIP